MLKIKVFDDDQGCWNLVEEIPWPYTTVKKGFLWWTWEVKEYMPFRQYCLKAVNRAKFLSTGRKILRVIFGDEIIWQHWVWHIDTKTYVPFSWGSTRE